MWYRLAADLTVLLHALFVLFVLCGGLLCHLRLAWACLHLPAACWGIWIEYSGRICPLTPLENFYRQLAGQQGYSGGFIEHYLIPLRYPPGLTRTTQWLLGALVLIVNLVIYGWVIHRRRSQASS